MRQEINEDIDKVIDEVLDETKFEINASKRPLIKKHLIIIINLMIIFLVI